MFGGLGSHGSPAQRIVEEDNKFEHVQKSHKHRMAALIVWETTEKIKIVTRTHVKRKSVVYLEYFVVLWANVLDELLFILNLSYLLSMETPLLVIS